MTDTIIFDLDGTLLDTVSDLQQAVNHAGRSLSEAHGLPQWHDLSAQQVKALLGNGYKHLVDGALGAAVDETLKAEGLQRFKTFYEAHCLDFTAPYEGILPTMRTLRERGLRLGILSNKGDDAVQSLAHRFFEGMIDTAVGERPGSRRKPCPDGLLECIRRLGTTPERTLYVGDTEVDVETAVRAGVRCCACLWGFRDADFLRSLRPDSIVAHPSELLRVV